MADQPSTQDSGEPGAAGSDSLLPPGSIVFPGGEASDDAPTIISKNPPTQPHAENAFTTGLRGRVLAHFELEEPIGVGGMAAVIRARDTQLDRVVALKILPPEMANDPENVRRFHQEARAAAKLDHENIARVYYCGEDQRLHFIAFEFVDGENLRAVLERRGRLPVPEAVRYMLHIATGLEHSASRGVVHRDIKPSNIIVTPTGRAKLVDMGLARSLGPTKDPALTQSGVTLGTFDYISPEQALEPREADARSDIYSLGCTFYHLLAGQPPVPDGTVAKKLHHHQHVEPTDPRQLNPDVPDEVAAILARMMAKDPSDRYQRPVHLVQHLLQVARQVGAADDLPESIRFADGPLPLLPKPRSRLRPATVLLAVGVLLLAVSLAPPPGSDVKAPKSSLAAKGSPGAKGSGKVNPAGTAAESDLAEALKSDAPLVHVRLSGIKDLSETPLVFEGAGRTLVVESKKPQDPAKIRFRYQPREDVQDLLAGLTLKGGTIEFRNLSFELEADQTPENLQVAIVAARRGAQVTFKDCVFEQKANISQPFVDYRETTIPMASVALVNLEEDGIEPPKVALHDCFFINGQSAVALNGNGDVLPTRCRFGPHGALFHMRGDSKASASRLTLRKCSAFVVFGPAFRLDQHARCEISAEQSIFSCPERVPDTQRDPPDLIRQTDAPGPAVRFAGKHNCYHSLTALWVRPGEKIPASRSGLEEFVAQVVQAGGSGDEASFVPRRSETPWAAADPLTALRERSGKAFEPSAQLAALRIADNPTRAIGWPGHGAETYLLKELPAAALAREIVVDPKAEEKTGESYQDLSNAFRFVQRPGSKAKEITILIRASGVLDIPSVVLNKPDLAVTIKGDPDFHPILSLEKVTEKSSALFKVHDGHLHFENIELLVDPDQDFETLSAVRVEGMAVVTFKRCILTLREPSGATSLSAVMLDDLDNAMKTSNPTRSNAAITFQDCLVRGKGDLLSVKGGRPFELDLQNSLVVLAGSGVGWFGLGKDLPGETAATLRLANVSAFTAEPFVSLKTKTGKGLLATQADVKDSLFVALGKRPLVAYEGVDAAQVKFDWRGMHNAYHGYDAAENRNVVTESDARFVQGKLSIPASNLSQVTPNQCRPDPNSELSAYGATLDPQQLPRMNPPGASTPPNRDDDD